MGRDIAAKPNNPNALESLLLEGARSYVEAATSLFEYERTIMKGCRSALTNHLDTYSKALGVDLDEEDIRDYQWPKGDDREGVYANLGVYVKNISFKGIPWWETYCALGWDHHDNANRWFGVWVGISVPKRMAAACFNSMQRLRLAHLGLDDEEVVWTGSNLGIDNAADFESALDEVLTRWVRAVRKIGGLREIVRAATK